MDAAPHPFEPLHNILLLERISVTPRSLCAVPPALQGGELQGEGRERDAVVTCNSWHRKREQTVSLANYHSTD